MKIQGNLGYICVPYFQTERFWVLKVSQYSSNVKSHLQKKFHGDLECLQMCHTTFIKDFKQVFKSHQRNLAIANICQKKVVPCQF